MQKNFDHFNAHLLNKSINLFHLNSSVGSKCLQEINCIKINACFILCFY